MRRGSVSWGHYITDEFLRTRIANDMRVTSDIVTTLTVREKEVLALIGQGQSTKEIAVELSISIETVGDHRKNICRKLDLHSTAQLAACGALLLSSGASTIP
jgi:DNA-binding CsgD family transcriptional regulator